jgi:hypothetical protein
MYRTEGVSPKAKWAALAVAIGGVIGVVAQMWATGEFNAPELATAIATIIGPLLALIGAYQADPGRLVPVNPGPASDDLLGPDAGPPPVI